MKIYGHARIEIRKCKNTLNKFQIHPCLMCQIILVVLLCRTKCLQLVMMAMVVLLLRHFVVLLRKFINSIDFRLEILGKFLTLFCALQVSAVGERENLSRKYYANCQTAVQTFPNNPSTNTRTKARGIPEIGSTTFFQGEKKNE
jgi:hypothetical protein